jgi:hypothetical protein
MQKFKLPCRSSNFRAGVQTSVQEFKLPCRSSNFRADLTRSAKIFKDPPSAQYCRLRGHAPPSRIGFCKPLGKLNRRPRGVLFDLLQLGYSLCLQNPVSLSLPAAYIPRNRWSVNRDCNPGSWRSPPRHSTLSLIYSDRRAINYRPMRRYL